MYIYICTPVAHSARNETCSINRSDSNLAERFKRRRMVARGDQQPFKPVILEISLKTIIQHAKMNSLLSANKREIFPSPSLIEIRQNFRAFAHLPLCNHASFFSRKKASLEKPQLFFWQKKILHRAKLANRAPKGRQFEATVPRKRDDFADANGRFATGFAVSFPNSFPYPLLSIPLKLPFISSLPLSLSLPRSRRNVNQRIDRGFHFSFALLPISIFARVCSAWWIHRAVVDRFRIECLKLKSGQRIGRG